MNNPIFSADDFIQRFELPEISEKLKTAITVMWNTYHAKDANGAKYDIQVDGAPRAMQERQFHLDRSKATIDLVNRFSSDFFKDPEKDVDDIIIAIIDGAVPENFRSYPFHTDTNHQGIFKAAYDIDCEARQMSSRRWAMNPAKKDETQGTDITSQSKSRFTSVPAINPESHFLFLVRHARRSQESLENVKERGWDEVAGKFVFFANPALLKGDDALTSHVKKLEEQISAFRPKAETISLGLRDPTQF